MPSKISELTEITTTPSTGIIPVVTGGVTKKITKANLVADETGDVRYELIESQEIGGTDGIFDFTSIPQTYDHLELILRLRGSVTATYDLAYIFINNDTTTTNYMSEGINAHNGSAAGGYGYNYPIASFTPAASSDASYWTYTKIIIPEYTNTDKMKIWHVNYLSLLSVTDLFVGDLVEYRMSTEAVSRITIQPDGYSTDNFVQYSTAFLYGILTV